MKKPIKVAYITNVCSHYRVGLYEELAHSFDVEYYFFSAGNEWYAEKKNKTDVGNLNAINLKKTRWLGGLNILPNLISKLLTINYDVYVKCINGKFILPLVYIIAKLKGKPFVLVTGLWMHPQSWVHRFTFPIARYIYNHASAVVVYGEHVKNYLETVGVSKDRIFIGNLAVDNSLFSKTISLSEQIQKKNELNIFSRRVILFVGRLMPEKGLEYLLEAHRIISDKADSVLLIIGDGPLKDSLKKQAERNVYFVDYVPNDQLIYYYALADIFVLPSVTTPMVKETWGLVINEAMNQRCAIIATEAVGAAAGGLVINGKNGFIVPEKNVKALSMAILQLLTDDELRENMSAFSGSYIAKWNYVEMAKGYTEAIYSVIE